MLYKHQLEFIKKGTKKGFLVWGTGTGKSRTSLEWATDWGVNEQLAPGKAVKTLIICPKYLKKKWQKEVESYRDGYNKSALMFVNDFLNGIKIVSKEEFRKDWDTLSNHEIIIIDEAHYFSGMKSQMSKNLLKYIKKHNTQYILGLTATPFLSNPLNIYVLGKIVGKTGYKWSYPYFMQSYYNQVQMGMRTIPVMKKGIKTDLAQKVGEIADVVSMKDCVDLPEEQVSVEYFSLTPEQKKEIANLQEINHLTRWTKTHQICGGHLKGDEYNEDKEIKSEKMSRVMDIISANKKTMVVCRYVGETEMIAREIVSSSDEALANKKVLMINGDVEDKQAVLDEANASDDCVLLVTAACSEGWEAPTFDTMVFYSYDFSLKNYIQMKGRIQRINAIQKCNYISLVVENTIDEDVYKNVAVNKNDFHLSIYAQQQDPNFKDHNTVTLQYSGTDDSWYIVDGEYNNTNATWVYSDGTA